MVLLSDIDPSAVQVRDTGESFVSLRDFPSLLIDESMSQISSQSPFFCCVRESVALKLEAASRLLPSGVSLLVKEGYRPAGAQRSAFDSTFRKYAELHPGKGEDEIFAIVAQYVAPIALAGHPTGGAVDLTLVRDGREVFMGTVYNDEPQETENRTFLSAPNITAEAAENRRILIGCLEPVGLLNYPSEWWHWSYGDSYWAYLNDVPALYSPAEEEDLPRLIVRRGPKS